jgi:sensor histidine kinase YesM
MVGDWTNLLLLLFVFLINLFVLVPRLLLNNKRTQYLIVVIVMMFIVAVTNLIIHPFSGPPPHPGAMVQPPDFQTERPFDLQSLLGSFLNNLITALLIIGSSTALELEYKWVIEQKLRKDAEKEHLKTSLALLRHQVSPHFFMNTLNNIHTLVETDTDKAQDAIVRLSALMRYLLYDSAQNQVELKKEIEFITSFISLMQLRYSEEVEIKVVLPESIPNTLIPPMLFISFIENAFKHGVNYPSKSYIHVELRTDKNSLYYQIRNSKPLTPVKTISEHSGIGLENIKKSLNLLYKDEYSLIISDTEKEYEVNLTIPL